MKIFLLLAATVFTGVVWGQDVDFTIKAQGQTLQASFNGDNSSKTLFLNSRSKTIATDRLAIYNHHQPQEKDWKRTFIIFNDKDSEIVKFSNGKAAKYEAGLKDILKSFLRKKSICCTP